ncbi:PAS-domain containing protein [Paracoccus caeni]|uniref:PAS-domain containing protein n=1 Tax=Paracoccus caeni TaxID=657651 RepID=A0A934SNL2_9RHOB|nr:PAS domain-containing protein [Paracoccus caeni]MBK4217603.1 PAS-domain containing protein [Paracoccus caeni]
MDFHSFCVAIIAILSGALSLVLAILGMRIWDDRRKGTRRRRSSDGLDGALRPMVFLFNDGRLIDATPPARNLFDRLGAVDHEWGRLMQWIGPRFPDDIGRLDQLPRLGRVELVGHSGNGSASLRLLAEQIDQALVRITLTDPQADGAGIVVDSMSLQAMEEELDLLRRALDQTPMLVWRQDRQHGVTWANAAYLRQAEALSDGEVTWPLPRLLEPPQAVPGASTSSKRAALNDNGNVRWYDCHNHQIDPDQSMMFALPADAAIRAERSLREFVQTLTKTFADLPTGLAIFDRERHLQLFNPALIDLTGLPTGFLTARPTLFDLLDKLRELRMVPEPKDYRSWRQQMYHLESAAATGRHVETWSLPGGQTYRVTGRPHPDGAVAFLIEDITSEISLTRKFRADLSLGNTVLDAIDDALVVFAPGDQVALTNQAYRNLWGEGTPTKADMLADWQARGSDGPGFAALRARLSGENGDARRDGIMTGPDGNLLSWTVNHLGLGRQMISFRSADMNHLSEPVQSSAPLADVG